MSYTNLSEISNNEKGGIFPHAVLKLYVNKENASLIELYKEHVEKHNESIGNTSFPNSGFDLFIPKTEVFDIEFQTKMINLEVKTEMIYFSNFGAEGLSSAFYVFPRSSISKTPLMLANHTGIIDSGYRGFLIGAFRWMNNIPASRDAHENKYVVSASTRLLQICHPSLCPVFVKLVESEDELSSTERGTGGFGSTGIIGSL